MGQSERVDRTESHRVSVCVGQSVGLIGQNHAEQRNVWEKVNELIESHRASECVEKVKKLIDSHTANEYVGWRIGVDRKDSHTAS